MKKTAPLLASLLIVTLTVVADDSLLDSTLDETTNSNETVVQNEQHIIVNHQVGNANPQGEQIRIQHADRPKTLLIRYGYGKPMGDTDENVGYGGDIEWTNPLGLTDFDLSFRFSYHRQECEERKVYYHYTYSWWGKYKDYDYYWETEHRDLYTGEAVFLWKPYRDGIVSPFIGGGLDYGNTESSDDNSLNIVGRIGVFVDFVRMFPAGGKNPRVFLSVDYIVSSEINDLIGDLSFYLTSRMKLHTFIEGVDIDFGKSRCYGGGLSFDF